jgi:3-hydroxyacyl-[acyl-carrier-protein] dehydratase
MLLKDKFYTVLHREDLSTNEAVFLCSLNPDCDVYRGHFPGKPVSPGVCNIEMIRECAEMLTEKDLFISTIKQCRLTAVVSPAICPKVDVSVKVAFAEDGESCSVEAHIRDERQTYMELKGTFVVKG